MKKKIGGIVICVLLLSSVSLYPVLGNPVEFLSARKGGHANSFSLSVSREGEIRDMYNHLLDAVRMQEGPYEILCCLFSYPEVKDAIGELTDTRIVHSLEILFSQGHPFLKIVAIKQFGDILDAMGQSKEVHQLEKALDCVLSSNYSSTRDVFSFLNTTGNPEDISLWEDEWTCHVQKNPWIKTAIENLEFDYFVFWILFTVCIVVWGFAYGGLSVLIPDFLPDLAMLMNTVALGFLGSIIVGAFFGDGPIITWLLEFLHPYEDIVLAVLSAAICLLVMGVYYYLGFLTTGGVNLLVQVFSCGFFVVWPPVVAAVILTTLQSFMGGI